MNYRDTIEYREYCLSYYRDSKKSTIAQPSCTLHFLEVSFPLAYVMHGKGTDLSHLSAPIVTKGWGDGEGWEWGGVEGCCVCLVLPALPRSLAT